MNAQMIVLKNNLFSTARKIKVQESVVEPIYYSIIIWQPTIILPILIVNTTQKCVRFSEDLLHPSSSIIIILTSDNTDCCSFLSYIKTKSYRIIVAITLLLLHDQLQKSSPSIDPSKLCKDVIMVPFP